MNNHWRVLLSVLVAAVAAAALALPGSPPSPTTIYQYDRTGNLRQTTVSCVPGFVLCGENCVSSVLNCGGCGIACSANHVAPACSGGSCNAGVCAAGWADCNGNKQSDGCETDLTSNVANCSACGIACSTNHVAPACSGGSCNAGVCAAGWGDCNGNKQSDGCEIDLTSNVANCGACGNVCFVPTNGYATCTAGTCGIVCNAPYVECGGHCITNNGCPRGYYFDWDLCRCSQ